MVAIATLESEVTRLLSSFRTVKASRKSKAFLKIRYISITSEDVSFKVVVPPQVEAPVAEFVENALNLFLDPVDFPTDMQLPPIFVPKNVIIEEKFEDLMKLRTSVLSLDGADWHLTVNRFSVVPEEVRYYFLITMVTDTIWNNPNLELESKGPLEYALERIRWAIQQGFSRLWDKRMEPSTAGSFQTPWAFEQPEPIPPNVPAFTSTLIKGSLRVGHLELPIETLKFMRISTGEAGTALGDFPTWEFPQSAHGLTFEGMAKFVKEIEAKKIQPEIRKLPIELGFLICRGKDGRIYNTNLIKGTCEKLDIADAYLSVINRGDQVLGLFHHQYFAPFVPSMIDFKLSAKLDFELISMGSTQFGSPIATMYVRKQEISWETILKEVEKSITSLLPNPSGGYMVEISPGQKIIHPIFKESTLEAAEGRIKRLLAPYFDIVTIDLKDLAILSGE